MVGMNKYYLDTEFISATKGVYRFFEVAILGNNHIDDYHFRPNLSKWEQKYYQNIASGKYGVESKNVFEKIQLLVEQKIDFTALNNDFTQINLTYNHYLLEDYELIFEKYNNCNFYIWDPSNDHHLFKYCKQPYQLIDVQKKWITKFGGQQMGLERAYKHVLYNLDRKDVDKLIGSGHLACFDVAMLKIIDEFIDNFESDILKPIPITSSYYQQSNEKISLSLQKSTAELSVLNAQDVSILPFEDEKKLIYKKNRLNKRIQRLTNQQVSLDQLPICDNQWWS